MQVEGAHDVTAAHTQLCCAAAGSDGISRDVDGGKAMSLDGDIVLCGRSDGTAQRGYSGSLAELAIWDTVITSQQVAMIYKSVSAACSHGPLLSSEGPAQ